MKTESLVWKLEAWSE